MIFETLLKTYGPQDWWPAETPFEVMVGAILVQNTNWTNVERAITALKARKLLDLGRLRALSDSELADLIRPAGYFRVKARRLRNLLDFLASACGGNIRRMADFPVEVLRQQLLSVNGIGPETADSILLYALDKPVFVVDAYTRRLLNRHGFPEAASDYQKIQSLFTTHLAPDARLFNEYHALIVRLGKDFKGAAAADEKTYPLRGTKFFL